MINKLSIFSWLVHLQSKQKVEGTLIHNCSRLISQFLLTVKCWQILSTTWRFGNQAFWLQLIKKQLVTLIREHNLAYLPMCQGRLCNNVKSLNLRLQPNHSEKKEFWFTRRQEVFTWEFFIATSTNLGCNREEHFLQWLQLPQAGTTTFALCYISMYLLPSLSFCFVGCRR